MSKFNYIESSRFEIILDGCTALHIFDMFYGSKAITINRRKYPSFLAYLKELMKHKDIEMEEWSPPLLQTLTHCTLPNTKPTSDQVLPCDPPGGSR
jgi:hypothetical protein